MTRGSPRLLDESSIEEWTTMPKAIPSKPPPQARRRTYVVTTTSRVPGCGTGAKPERDPAADGVAEESADEIAAV
jgi:hypothetical protein